MQGTFREDDEVIPLQRMPQRTPAVPDLLECQLFGHSWEPIGVIGEKQCSTCGITGYCPGCTPNPTPPAKPFYCSIHTPLESR